MKMLPAGSTKNCFAFIQIQSQEIETMNACVRMLDSYSNTLLRSVQYQSAFLPGLEKNLSSALFDVNKLSNNRKKR